MRLLPGIIAWVACACAAPTARSAPAQDPESPGPRLTFPGEAVELSMADGGGRAIVSGRINGSRTARLIIDTGSNISALDRGIATSLGLEVVGSQAVGAPGGARVQSDLVLVPRIVVGDLTIENVVMVAIDIAEMTGGLMEGILSMELFREVTLTIDLSGATAEVSRVALTAATPNTMPMIEGDEMISFYIDVAGRRVPTHLDTGSPAGFTLPIELMDSLRLAGEVHTGTAGLVGGSRTVHRGTLDGIIRVGALAFRNPEVGFMDPSPGAANLGSAILGDLVIGIDQKNRMLSLRPMANAVRRTVQGQPRRLGVQFRRMGSGPWDIASVERGSIGERAGLRSGDSVHRLNGKVMSEYQQTELRDLFGGSATLRLEIERDGERQVIEIP